MAKRNRLDTNLLLDAGETIPGHHGKYLIESVLSHTRPVAVYAAHDVARPWIRITLKEFTPAPQPDGQKANPAAFDREVLVARHAAGHPLIPRVQESFPHDQRFYIARELIPGETLASLIVRYPVLPPRTLRKWAACLCDLLAFLHARGVAARDLTPSGISVSPDGYPSLRDLGAAQLFPDPPAPGVVEDVAGELARADLFALGSTLYEAMTGLPPAPEKIRGTDVTGDLASRPDADLPLAHLVARALGARPADGPLTAAALQRELRGFVPPVLLADTHRLTFVNADPVPQTVRLFNVGGGELNPEVRSLTSWLRMDPPVRQDGATEVTVHRIPGRTQGGAPWMHGRLEVVNRGADGAGVGTPQGDRWPIDCSVEVQPVPDARPPGPAPAPPSRPVGQVFRHESPPNRNSPGPAPAAESHKETDIVPRSTVFRLIAGILLLAFVIGYVVVSRIQSRSVGAPPPVVARNPPAAPAPHPAVLSGATASEGNLLQAAPGPSNWVLEQFRPAVATMTTDGTAVVVTVVHADGKHWHVQFHPKAIGLEEGKPYVLSFRAKADRPCDLPIEASINQGDYHPIGLQTHAALTTQWQSFSYPFTSVHVLPSNNRLPIFMVGQKPCRIWVSDVTLKKASR